VLYTIFLDSERMCKFWDAPLTQYRLHLLRSPICSRATLLQCDMSFHFDSSGSFHCFQAQKRSINSITVSPLNTNHGQQVAIYSVRREECSANGFVHGQIPTSHWRFQRWRATSYSYPASLGFSSSTNLSVS